MAKTKDGHASVGDVMITPPSVESIMIFIIVQYYIRHKIPQISYCQAMAPFVCITRCDG